MSNFLEIPLLSEEFLARMLRQTAPEETLASTITVTATPAKPQTRCPVCRHKLQLADMPCRCGVRHCGNHRLPELHACTYDHKAHDRTVLEKQVTRCVADKLQERL